MDALTGKAKVRQVAGKLAAAGSREDKGNFGEARAKEWFERKNLDYFHWPQTKASMPLDLSHRGGKRPDFAVLFGDELVYFDAKYQDTANVTEFGLDDLEISKFLVFREWIRDTHQDGGARDVVLMVYPIELNGNRFVLIHLDEIRQGREGIVRGKPGRLVSLSDREDMWLDQVPANPPKLTGCVAAPTDRGTGAFE